MFLNKKNLLFTSLLLAALAAFRALPAAAASDTLPTVSSSANFSTICLSLGEEKNLLFRHADPLSSCFSSDPEVVSVSADGTLRANDIGSAQIVYSIHGQLYQRRVYVSALSNIYFSGSSENTQTENTESLNLPEGSLQTEEPVLFIEKGDSHKIQLTSSSLAVIAKYGKASWNSDKKGIVKVDSQGNITAKKKGSATVTCSLGNVSCNIYVNVITDSYEGKACDFTMLTSSGKERTYRLFKQNAHNYPAYDNFIAWHGCATCSLATVLGAYNESYSGILPSSVIDGPEKQFAPSEDWNREHVKRSLRSQMPLSLYGISSILDSCGVSNDYVRTYKRAEAAKDITTHLKSGNAVIFEVRQKNSRTGKKSSRWTNSYHTMVLLGVLTNGKVLVCDSIDRSWYSGGDRLKIVELSDIMDYMFPCTSFSESMYYDGASSDGGYIKIQESAE